MQSVGIIAGKIWFQEDADGNNSFNSRLLNVVGTGVHVGSQLYACTRFHKLHQKVQLQKDVLHD